MPLPLGQLQHSPQYLPMLVRQVGDLGAQLLQGHRAAAEDAFEQVLPGVDGHPDKPSFFMLLALKGPVMEQIFEKHRLKNVLGIRFIFQMDHAQPPHGVAVPLNGPVGLRFVPHGLPSSPLRSLPVCYQPPWQPRPQPRQPVP